MPDTSSGNKGLKVFVSYPGKDGLAIAKQAANVLKQYGHIAYVFDNHKTLGVLIFEEIALKIRRWSEVLLYICTASSLKSWGQRLEVGYALSDRKVKLMTIVLDGAQVPDVLEPFVREPLQSGQFQQQFQPIVDRLPKIVEMIQRLDEDVTVSIS
jgi:hypothetical protein